MDLPPPQAEIVVTGRALPATDAARAYDQLTLDAAALWTPSGRVEEALRLVPDLSSFRRATSTSASPTAQGISFRGLSGTAASRATVTLDGVPQTDIFAGWIAWGPVNAADVETARVVRGGGAVVAGPGALTGAIALSSAPPADLVAARGGSRDSVDVLGGLAVPAGAGAFAVNGRFLAGDGALLVDPAQAGPVDVPARYRQWAVRARALAPLGRGELQAGLAVFDDQRLRGLPGSETGASGGDASLRFVQQEGLPLELLAWGQIRDFTARFVSTNAARTQATVTLDQEATPAAGGGLRAEIRPLGWLSLGGAVEGGSGETQEKFRFVGGRPTAMRVAGGAFAIGGLFAEAAAERGDWLLTGGIRADRWQLTDGRLEETDLATGAHIRSETAPDRSGWAVSARGAVDWTVPHGNGLSLRAAGYSGWRLPTLNELYRPFRVGLDATAANPLLDPERLAGAEAGIGWAPDGAFSLALTGFWNRLSDPIANVTRGRGPGVFPGVGFVGAGGIYRVRENLAAMRAVGVEADASLALGRWSAQAGLARVFAVVDGGSAAPALTGKRPAQSPGFWATLGLGYTAPGWQARLDLRHEGPRFEDDLNTRTLSGFTVIDLGLSVGLLPWLSLTLDLQNAANAVVETGFSGNLVERAEPRTLLMGVRLAR